VLQTDTTEKKERKLCGNSNRQNSEQMLGLTGMQAEQTNSRCWMDYGILCLSCNKVEKHRMKSRPKSEFSLKPGGKLRIKILILI